MSECRDTINMVAVSGLSSVYYNHFHDRLPFLGDKEQLARANQPCPLQYWAVVSVACRSLTRHREMYVKLAWPIRRLALETTFKNLPSLHVIQGLLLLCIWPLSFAAMLDDPSWALCGIARQKADHIGLLRQGFEKDFTFPAIRASDL